MDSSERLARVQHLLAGLPGPYGNEQLWTLVNVLDGAGVFDRVFAFLQECAVVDSVSRSGHPPQAPQDAAQLQDRLSELDQEAALSVLVETSSETLAYRTKGRYSKVKAREVFGRLADLLGHQTRWWSNTDLTGWDPVSRHTMDALVIGAGGGVVVAVLAVDED
ncbi:hypothetical protein [Micromonospora chersina]|uniref:hypothetical protein n=1 Tax=Micromonospora chersina TaxID=47854 RepID=UPI003D91D9F6